MSNNHEIDQKKNKKRPPPYDFEIYSVLFHEYGLEHHPKRKTKSGGDFTYYKNNGKPYCTFHWRTDNKNDNRFVCKICNSDLKVRKSDGKICIQLKLKNCSGVVVMMNNNNNNNNNLRMNWNQFNTTVKNFGNENNYNANFQNVIGESKGEVVMNNNFLPIPPPPPPQVYNYNNNHQNPPPPPLNYNNNNNSDNSIISPPNVNQIGDVKSVYPISNRPQSQPQLKIRSSVTNHRVRFQMLQFFPRLIEMKGICVQLYLRIDPLDQAEFIIPKEIEFRHMNGKSEIVDELFGFQWGEGIGETRLIPGKANYRLHFYAPTKDFLDGTLDAELIYDYMFNKLFPNLRRSFLKNGIQFSTMNLKSKKRKLSEVYNKGDERKKIGFYGKERIYLIDKDKGERKGGDHCLIFFSMNVGKLYLSHIQDSFSIKFGVMMAEILLIQKTSVYKNLRVYQENENYHRGSNLVAQIVTPEYPTVGQVDVFVGVSNSKKFIFRKNGFYYFDTYSDIEEEGKSSELSTDDNNFNDNNNNGSKGVEEKKDDGKLYGFGYDVNNISFRKNKFSPFGWDDLFNSAARNNMNEVLKIFEMRRINFDKVDSLGNTVLDVVNFLGLKKMENILENEKKRIEYGEEEEEGEESDYEKYYKTIATFDHDELGMIFNVDKPESDEEGEEEETEQLQITMKEPTIEFDRTSFDLMDEGDSGNFEKGMEVEERDWIFANVKIIENDSKDKYSRTKFGSLFQIVKARPNWFLVLYPKNKQKLKIDLVMDGGVPNILNVKGGNQKILNVKFKEFEITIQFQRNMKFEYFQKTLLVINEMLNPSKKDARVKKKSGRDTKIRRKEKLKSSTPKISSSIFDSFKSHFMEPKSELYVENALYWSDLSYKLWLQNIPMECEGELTTLYEELCRRNLYLSLDSYFKENLTLWNLKNDIGLFWKRNEIEGKGKIIKGLLVFENADLMQIIEKEIIRIQMNDGIFCQEYVEILGKMIRGRKENEILQRIEDELRFEKRYLWNIMECRNAILFHLIYPGEGIDGLYKRMDQIEKKFIAEEAKYFDEKFLHSKGIERNSEDDRLYGSFGKIGAFYSHEINYYDWIAFLERFNEKLGIEIQKLSFEVYMKCKQNGLRKNQPLISKSELENTSLQKISLKEEATKNLNHRIERLKERIGNLKSGKNVSTLNKMIEKWKMQASDNDIELAEMKVNLQSQEKAKKEKEIKVNIKINERAGLNSNHEMESFLKVKQKTIDKWIEERLSRVGKRGGMFELVVKLVLSIPRKDYDLENLDLGLLHSHVQIGGLSLHWFDDSVVSITGLKNKDVSMKYKELIVVDAFAPIIMNNSTLIDQIDKLAEAIVKMNVSCEYKKFARWNTIPKRGKLPKNLDCQEMAFRLLDILDYTSFSKEVNHYFSELVSHFKNPKKITSLRWFTVKKSFRDKFGKLLKELSDDDGRVYFKNHLQLDEFFIRCLEIDQHFEINWPGLFQLFKGFDRSYWTALPNDGKNKELRPYIKKGKCYCPFVKKINTLRN